MPRVSLMECLPSDTSINGLGQQTVRQKYDMRIYKDFDFME